ncbi:MAG: hypothetical protein OXC61_03140 [Flavobacteriaceae bacterium]|nr:hypothetical protein [Flavobacteriaceae bacterium]
MKSKSNFKKQKPIDARYVQTKKVQMPKSSYQPTKKELEMPFENPGLTKKQMQEALSFSIRK